jgi:hypothetical protein
MASTDFNFVVDAKNKSLEIKAPFAITTYDLGNDFAERINDNGEDKKFLNFLLKIGMNETGSYEWCNSDGESGMYYYPDKKQLSIEAYRYYEGGFHLTLDLSDNNVSKIVISELSKLATQTIEKLYELPATE